MANKKITSLTELTSPAVGDFIPIVDVSDTTDSAEGTTKKIQVQELGVPQVVYKSADETVNNSTTLQDDDTLLFPVLANEVWAVQMFIMYRSGTTPDIKFALSLPSGATAHLSSMPYYDSSELVNSTSNNFSGIGASTTVGLIFIGTVTVSSTAGNVGLQWAQNTQNLSDTKVLAGSYIIATRLA